MSGWRAGGWRAGGWGDMSGWPAGGGRAGGWRAGGWGDMSGWPADRNSAVYRVGLTLKCPLEVPPISFERLSG